MNNRIRKRILSIVLGLAGLSLGIALGYRSHPANAPALSVVPAPVSEQPAARPVSPRLTALLEAGTVRAELSFTAGDSLYAALMRARNSGMIAFDGRDYPSLGYYVARIGSLAEGGGKHLIYFVNGKEASVGISSYMLHTGDSVVWKLE